jgi:transposase
MEERLTLTSKELKRFKVLEMIQNAQVTVATAATLLGVSERHCWRLLARYRQAGAAGLVHGNRGRASSQRLADAVRQQVLVLAQGVCRDYNDQHLTDVLREEHGLQVSRASVRRIRRSVGLASPHKYRRRRSHRRRERYPQFGMLFQIDASHHAWLEARGPRLALLAAIDDATNQVVGAQFRAQEDAAGYFLLLQDMGQRHGIPLALYADRHTIFQSPSKPTLEQELAGELPQSQFGRLCARLGIQLIAAHSPQAKGRIERLWGTWQDRLVKELRQAGANTLDAANQVLAAYLDKHNQRFAGEAQQPGSACRPLPDGGALDRLFSFRYQRRVANDHTIAVAGHRLQLPPAANGRSYARATVELYHAMDGRLLVTYQDQPLVTFLPAVPGPPRVEVFCPQTPTTTLPSQPAQPVQTAPAINRQPTARPAADHPWRRYPVAMSPAQEPQPAPAHPDIFTDRLT